MNAIFHLSCPSCGARVPVRSNVSLLVVCEYCRSMLVRQPDSRFADNGKASQVLEDYSLIQIGTTGRYLSRSFTVIGRLQKEHERGYRNEWYLWFDDGGDGWLSDNGGQYALTELKEKEYTQGPAYSDAVPGVSFIQYAGKFFTASDVRSAKNLSTKAQGELPFVLRKDEITHAVDYRCGKHFLTLDYTRFPPIPAAEDADLAIDFKEVDWSSIRNGTNTDALPALATGSPEPNRPELHCGMGVMLEDMHCQQLRTQEQILESAGKLRGKTDSLQCPNCGTPLTWVPGVAHHLVCPNCHADVNVTINEARLLGIYSMREAQIELLISNWEKLRRLAANPGQSSA